MTNEVNKLQEDIIRADIKQAEKLWKSMEDNLGLDYHLDRMTKDELVRVAAKYGVRGITSLKKSEAVERVRESVINNIDIVLNLLDRDGVDYLEEIISLGCKKLYNCSELINTNYFRNRGLLFTGTIENELNVILPKEIHDIIKDKLNKELKERAAFNSEIIKIFAGMVYYYGVLSFEKFNELLNERLGYNVELELIEALIKDGEELGFDYQIDGEMAFHIDVEEPVAIIEGQKENSDLDFLKIDKKRLMKAARPDFIEENKQAVKLEKVIGELFVIDKRILKEEIDNFSIAVKNEAPMKEAIETFLEAYEIESDDERVIFVEELSKLAKSVRKWSLKGHTQMEVDNMKRVVINEEKIGRNDPCKCGSKKKYKKCCGK